MCPAETTTTSASAARRAGAWTQPCSVTVAGIASAASPPGASGSPTPAIGPYTSHVASGTADAARARSAARTPPPPVPAITATRGAPPADAVVVARVPSRPVTSATPR